MCIAVGPLARTRVSSGETFVAAASAIELFSLRVYEHRRDDLHRNGAVQHRDVKRFPHPVTAIRDKGERKGEAAASLKARLLKTEPLDRAELASIKQHELITRGIGYLSRPKDVTPKDGDPFLSCCVAALAGPVGEPDYRYFDTIVATPEAEHLVRRCVQAIEGDRKVLIAFRLNDMKVDSYIRTKGERAGEPGASLESTLVHIGLIKIDGTQVYPTSQAQAEAPQAEDAPAPEAEVAADTVADQPDEPAEREPAGEVEEQEPALAASF